MLEELAQMLEELTQLIEVLVQLLQGQARSKHIWAISFHLCKQVLVNFTFVWFEAGRTWRLFQVNQDLADNLVHIPVPDIMCG